MKIALIDDALNGLQNFKQALWDSHEVLGVWIDEAPLKSLMGRVPMEIITSNLEEAAKAIQDFEPDLIFIDHDFGRVGFTGETLAHRLGYSKEMFVGTSSYYEQPYVLSFFRVSKTDYRAVWDKMPGFLERLKKRRGL